MPAYATVPAQSIVSGMPFLLFNQEVVTAGEKSIALASPGAGKGLYAPFLFIVQFSSIPSAYTLNYQGSLYDLDAWYQTLQQSINSATGQAFYEDYANFPFYRVQLASITWPNPSNPGNLTVAVVKH